MMVVALLCLLQSADGSVFFGNTAAMTAASSSFADRWKTQARAWISADDEDTAKRWGLEVALIKHGIDVHLLGGDKAQGMATAADLLKRYGPAYLLTSVSFAAASYAACYVAVARGVNVVALMSRFGLRTTAAAEKVGTASIAYVCHKAASPIRFPPTVALTPVVARRLFGRRDL